VRSFAPEFRDTEIPQNPGDAAESRNSQLLRHMALGRATAVLQVQMALGNRTVGTGPRLPGGPPPRRPPPSRFGCGAGSGALNPFLWLEFLQLSVVFLSVCYGMAYSSFLVHCYFYSSTSYECH